MFPEVDRAWTLTIVFGSLAAGTALVGLGFLAAERAVDALGAVGRRLRFALAPRCVDCGGKGYRRWKDGDGAPLNGWTDCRLCRGLGRIVDDGEEA